jgi:hypothetical protein
MDRQDEANGRFSIFTNAPKKQDRSAGILVTSHYVGTEQINKYVKWSFKIQFTS